MEATIGHEKQWQDTIRPTQAKFGTSAPRAFQQSSDVGKKILEVAKSSGVQISSSRPNGGKRTRASYRVFPGAVGSGSDHGIPWCGFCLSCRPAASLHERGAIAGHAATNGETRSILRLAISKCAGARRENPVRGEIVKSRTSYLSWRRLCADRLARLGSSRRNRRVERDS